MNKAELVKAVNAQVEGVTKEQTAKVLEALVETIVKEVRDNEGTIQLVGFGTFKVKKSNAREGRNPLNGEKVQIAASKTIAFKPTHAIKVATE